MWHLYVTLDSVYETVGHNPYKEENISFGFVFQIQVKLFVMPVMCPPWPLGTELLSSRERERSEWNQLIEKRGEKLNDIEHVTPIET